MADESYIIKFRDDGTATVARNIDKMGASAARATKKFITLQQAISAVSATAASGGAASAGGSVALIARNVTSVGTAVAATTPQIADLSKTITIAGKSTLISTEKIKTLGSTLQLTGESGSAAVGKLSVVPPAINRIGVSSTTAGAKVIGFGKRVKVSGEQGAVAATQFGSLARVLVLIGGVIGVRKVIEYGDAWTQLTNKIRIVSDSEEQLISTRQKLLNISKETRSSVSSNVALFQRMSLANRNLGKSEQELLAFTKATAQALAISGATASETASVILQLSQGLSNVTIPGQEMRTVILSGARIMKALQDATGLTLGEIKKLSAEGKFLSRDFVDAMLSQIPQLDADFVKLAKTVSEAGGVFKTNMTEFIGRISEATGLGKILANTIINISNNLGTLSVVIGAIGFAAIIANIGAITAGVVALGAALLPVIIVLGKMALIAGLFLLAYEAASTFFNETRTGSKVLLGITTVMEVVANVSRIVWKDMAEAIKTTFSRLVIDIKVSLNKLKNFATVMASQIKNIMTLDFDEMLSEKEFSQTLQSLADEFRNSLTDPVGKDFSDMSDRIKEELARAVSTFADSAKEINSTDFGDESFGEKMFANLKEDLGNLNELINGVQNNLSGIEAPDISTELEKSAGFLQSMKESLEGISGGSFFEGIKSGFESVSAESQKFKEQIAQLTSQTIKNFSDELTEALTGGEADFKSLARNAINSLLSIMIQAVITAAALAALNAIAPGTSQVVAASMKQRQFGGPVQAGQPTIVGERRPEIFVPNTAGRIVPNTGGQGEQGQQTTIVNVVDQQMFFDAMSSSSGQKILMNVISRNKSSVRG